MTYLRPWEPLVGPEHVVKGDLLVLAPHPDDEVIGCGGLIAAHRALGSAVYVVVMTDGGKGDPTGAAAGASYSELRRNEAREAARRIGGAEIEAWLLCFRLAWAEVVEDEALTAVLMPQIENLARHMRTREG